MRRFLAVVAVVAALLIVSLAWLTRGPSPRPDDAVVRGMHYAGLVVSDLGRSVALYESALGLRLVEQGRLAGESLIDQMVGREGAAAQTALLRSSNMQLRLMQFERTSAAAKATPRVEINGPGVAHVCVQAQQSTGAYQAFLAGGATPIGSPGMVRLVDKNPVYYSYSYDWDGNPFEIEHVDIAELKLEQAPKNQYRIRHIALATPDYDRLVAFYSQLLQQPRPRKLGIFSTLSGPKFDAMSGLPDTELKMAFFQTRNIELEIAQYVSHPTELPAAPRPFDALGTNLIMFEVDDLERAKALLLSAGGAQLKSGMMDGAPVLLGRDPDGNLLGFQRLSVNDELSGARFIDNGAS